MKIDPTAIATTAIRVLWFTLSISPFASLFLPWITLDGTDETLTGVSSIALLTSPVRDYLFGVNPVQALLLIFGPMMLVLLTILTGSRYGRRRSVYWAPPLMLVLALGTVYLTGDLVSATHEGLDAVAVISILLALHQLAIRIYVAMRGRQPFYGAMRRGQPVSRATRVLEAAIGARGSFR